MTGVARVTLLGLSLWGGLALGPLATAKAGEFEDFQAAQRAYDAGDFAVAVERFERLVGGEVPRLTQRVLILESRKYLGASYVFRNQRRAAARQFELLLREEEEYVMDPVVFPARVIELFNSIREEVVEERRRQQEEQQRLEDERRRREAERLLRERERLEHLLELATSETVERENSRVIATIPFGVGQFQNDDSTLGWTFLILDGALAAGSLTTFVIHEIIPDPAPDQDAEDVARGLRIANWVTTGAFAAAALVGIIQAHLAFVPVEHETREREVPDLDLGLEPEEESELSVDVALGPLGGSVRLTF